MLRPYGLGALPRQLGARQGFRLLHVWLVECVHTETDAQLLGRVRPRQELRAERERIGHEVAHDLGVATRSEEHTSELQSPCNLVCRLLLEKKKKKKKHDSLVGEYEH